MPILSIPFPWQSGLQTPFWLIRSREWSISALIFHDLNHACLKDNFPTPFIDQILDECAGSKVFSFMDGFFGYNQIQIKPEDQHKTAFICPWGTFAYQKMPFGLKNAGATFQVGYDLYFTWSQINYWSLFGWPWCSFSLEDVSFLPFDISVRKMLPLFG